MEGASKMQWRDKYKIRRLRHRWEDNIKKESRSNSVQCQSSVKSVMNIRIPQKAGIVLIS